MSDSVKAWEEKQEQGGTGQKFYFDEQEIIRDEKRQNLKTDTLEYLTKLILDPKTPEEVSIHLAELREKIIKERNGKTS